MPKFELCAKRAGRSDHAVAGPRETRNSRETENGGEFGPKFELFSKRARRAGRPDRAVAGRSRARNSRETKNGGEGGIRTLGTLTRSTVFETAPFDHSGTSPQSGRYMP
jgi:hypothetical protein